MLLPDLGCLFRPSQPLVSQSETFSLAFAVSLNQALGVASMTDLAAVHVCLGRRDGALDGRKVVVLVLALEQTFLSRLSQLSCFTTDLSHL